MSNYEEKLNTMTLSELNKEFIDVMEVYVDQQEAERDAQEETREGVISAIIKLKAIIPEVEEIEESEEDNTELGGIQANLVRSDAKPNL